LPGNGRRALGWLSRRCPRRCHHAGSLPSASFILGAATGNAARRDPCGGGSSPHGRGAVPPATVLTGHYARVIFASVLAPASLHDDCIAQLAVH
jgi:hypothetical protein